MPPQVSRKCPPARPLPRAVPNELQDVGAPRFSRFSYLFLSFFFGCFFFFYFIISLPPPFFFLSAGEPQVPAHHIHARGLEALSDIWDFDFPQSPNYVQFTHNPGTMPRTQHAKSIPPLPPASRLLLPLKKKNGKKTK